jgi:hypothetical protein
MHSDRNNGMASQFIVRSQLNQLIQTVLQSLVAPDALSFIPDISQTSLQVKLPLRVTLVDHAYFSFEIRYSNADYFHVQYYPDMHRQPTLQSVSSWVSVIKKFREWVEVVGEELAEPDPWSLLKQGSLLTESIPTGSGKDEGFTELELTRVHEHLDGIRDFLISEIKPSLDQLKGIDERFSYLEESARRQSKQDWANTVIGVVFTIATGLALAPDQANKLFQLTSTLLRSIAMKLIA